MMCPFFRGKSTPSLSPYPLSPQQMLKPSPAMDDSIHANPPAFNFEKNEIITVDQVPISSRLERGIFWPRPPLRHAVEGADGLKQPIDERFRSGRPVPCDVIVNGFKIRKGRFENLNAIFQFSGPAAGGVPPRRLFPGLPERPIVRPPRVSRTTPAAPDAVHTRPSS